MNARGRLLWFFTPAAACVSGLSLLAALCGREWIHMEERILNATTAELSAKREFIVKKTYAGLFNICETNPGELYFKCSKINIFSERDYVSDIKDSSSSVPYAILQSMVFFLLAVTLLITAEILLIYGYLQKRRRFLLLVAGLFFILSGLMILLGIVVFIATLKGEIAEKLRPASSYEPPLVSYHYGWSFLLVLVGFISEEMSAVLAFFFYQHWHKHELLLKSGTHRLLLRKSPPTVILESLPLPISSGGNAKQWEPRLASSYSLPSFSTALEQDGIEKGLERRSPPSIAESTSQQPSYIGFARSSQQRFSQRENWGPPLCRQDFGSYWGTANQGMKKPPNDMYIYTSSLPRNPTRTTLSKRYYYPTEDAAGDICRVCEVYGNMGKYKYSCEAMPLLPEFPRPYPKDGGYSYPPDDECWCSCYYENNSKCCCSSHYTCSYVQNPVLNNKPTLSRSERLITV